ncbi:MAG: hypothetical protein IKS29_02750 [Oscillospiraceae bacterium]|nr:hypothetical protein [Oscillospiraceae bacterium]
MQPVLKHLRRITDACMCVLLLLLMAYQVTGEALHEWIGMGMTVLVLLHQILNRKWYAALFKGRYNPYRILTTLVNGLLLAAFVLTALCGMSMSAHAVRFLYGMIPISLARRLHLALSRWSFVLMGLHLGLHLPAMLPRLRGGKKHVLDAVFCCLAGIGCFLFLRSGMGADLLFRTAFAFLDYSAPGALVLLQNLLMLLFWAFSGMQAALLCRKSQRRWPPLLLLAAAILLGLLLHRLMPLA